MFQNVIILEYLFIIYSLSKLSSLTVFYIEYVFSQLLKDSITRFRTSVIDIHRKSIVSRSTEEMLKNVMLCPFRYLRLKIACG